jgi:hypothetical protein
MSAADALKRRRMWGGRMGGGPKVNTVKNKPVAGKPIREIEQKKDGKMLGGQI